MIVSIIVAISENAGIGLNGQVPWKLSSDLKLFKEVTMGHYLIQGRRTYESIGKPLPGRHMVVLTRQPGYSPAGIDVAASLPEALGIARDAEETETFIGGGAGIYAEALPICNRIYLTRVHANVEADTFFPEFDQTLFKVSLKAEYSADPKNQYRFTYSILDKKKGGD